MHRFSSTRYAVALAVIAGVAGDLAFPTSGCWPLAILSVTGLTIATYARSVRAGAGIGFCYGLSFFLPLLHWTGIYVGSAPWLILGVTEASYLAVMGAGSALLLSRRGGWFLAAMLWVAQEFVRDRWPFGGFPWGRLAFSQADSPYRWFAALGGAPLVSFAVALTGTALAASIRSALQFRYHREHRNATLVTNAVSGKNAVTLLVLAVAIVVLAMALPTFGLKPRTSSDQQAVVAVIQGSTPDRGLEFNARRRQVLDNHVQQTLQLAADVKAGRVAAPVMVFWPENSSDIDPYDNPDAAALIQQAADAIGVPIMVGAVLNGPGPDHISNVGLLWFPGSGYSHTGPAARYTKRHPVPFAEYIPMRAIARLVSKDVDLVPRDMVAGSGNGLITGGPITFGDVICFEVAYDSLVRSSVQAGAQLLVVQTNNATFGHTAETYQQLAMSRLRAVETGRSVLQVSTTGVSAVIAPDGSILQRSGALFTPARLVGSVALTTKDTIATRLGPVPEYILSACAVAGVVLCCILRWLTSRPIESLTKQSQVGANTEPDEQELELGNKKGRA